jgi:hypothetical protein
MHAQKIRTVAETMVAKYGKPLAYVAWISAKEWSEPVVRLCSVALVGYRIADQGDAYSRTGGGAGLARSSAATQERAISAVSKLSALIARSRLADRTAIPDRSGAGYWRWRASQARAQASNMHDADARRALLGIADNYDQLAARAERVRNARATRLSLTSAGAMKGTSNR